MANIAELGGLQPVEEISLADGEYVDTKEFTPIPAKGVYVVQAPGTFPQAAFGVSKAGALTAQVDPSIVGPTNVGYTLRFTKVSAKVFQRGNAKVSQLGDYLRACGMKSRLATAQDQIDAVEGTANRQYQVELDWRAYNKNTGWQVEGMERFPSDGKGGYLPFIDDPNDFEKDENGNVVHDAQGAPVHTRLRANVYVRRYIAAA